MITRLLRRCHINTTNRVWLLRCQVEAVFLQETKAHADMSNRHRAETNDMLKKQAEAIKLMEENLLKEHEEVQKQHRRNLEDATDKQNREFLVLLDQQKREQEALVQAFSTCSVGFLKNRYGAMMTSLPPTTPTEPSGTASASTSWHEPTLPIGAHPRGVWPFRPRGRMPDEGDLWGVVDGWV